MSICVDDKMSASLQTQTDNPLSQQVKLQPTYRLFDFIRYGAICCPTNLTEVFPEVCFDSITLAVRIPYRVTFLSSMFRLVATSVAGYLD